MRQVRVLPRCRSLRRRARAPRACALPGVPAGRGPPPGHGGATGESFVTCTFNAIAARRTALRVRQLKLLTTTHVVTPSDGDNLCQLTCDLCVC